MNVGPGAITLVFAILLHIAGPAAAQAPIIDNPQVTVWDITSGPWPQTTLETLTVELTPRAGHVEFHPRYSGPAGSAAPGQHVVVVAFKADSNVPPLANRSGYPSAFPRPGSITVVNNERVMVSDYTWKPGEPTPTHFHDKNVVVVYLQSGGLRSVTPDGAEVVNNYPIGTIRFNLRDRVHSEVLASGQQRAILVELKR